MTTKSAFGIAALFALGLVAAGASCASPGDTITLGGGDASGPSFIPTDAGEAGDAADANVTTPLLECVGTECPYPYETCTDENGVAGYKCGSNRLTDDSNCGECGNVCQHQLTGLQMESHCVAGKCQAQCVNGDPSITDPQDCNGIVDDGCEIDIANDPDNCGACGKKCGNNPDGTRQQCQKSRCGCAPGYTYCNAVIGCVDLSKDPENCGKCENVCPDVTTTPPPNAGYSCSSGTCGVLGCETGWADCNKTLTDGCETNIVSNANCGACGKACDPGQTCIIATDNSVKCACPPNLTLCGNECVDLLSDPSNCGVCSHSCRGPGGGPVGVNGDPNTATCDLGFCGLGCLAGYADCDGDGTCETNLMIDGLHCGSCGTRCDTESGQPCIGGSCLMVACGGETK